MLKSCLLRKDFDFRRNSRPTVPLYADRRELLGFRNFFHSLPACRKGFFDTLRAYRNGMPSFKQQVISNTKAGKKTYRAAHTLPSFCAPTSVGCLSFFHQSVSVSALSFVPVRTEGFRKVYFLLNSFREIMVYWIK